MNVKQFKIHLMRGLIRPEYFYIPLPDRKTEPETGLKFVVTFIDIPGLTGLSYPSDIFDDISTGRGLEYTYRWDTGSAEKVHPCRTKADKAYVTVGKCIGLKIYEDGVYKGTVCPQFIPIRSSYNSVYETQYELTYGLYSYLPNYVMTYIEDPRIIYGAVFNLNGTVLSQWSSDYISVTESRTLNTNDITEDMLEAARFGAHREYNPIIIHHGMAYHSGPWQGSSEEMAELRSRYGSEAFITKKYYEEHRIISEASATANGISVTMQMNKGYYFDGSLAQNGSEINENDLIATTPVQHFYCGGADDWTITYTLTGLNLIPEYYRRWPQNYTLLDGSFDVTDNLAQGGYRRYYYIKDMTMDEYEGYLNRLYDPSTTVTFES